MKRWSWILLAALSVSACDEKKDEFDQIDPVKAPEAKGPAEPIEGDSAAMPEGHPPVDGTAPAIAQAAPTQVAFAGPQEFGKVGPLRWSAPAGWQAVQPASQMRLAEYLVPADSGEPATMTVFYFGPAGGGGIDVNIERWTGQFGEDGKNAKRGELMAGGMKVHTVDASGTYNAGMAGGNQPDKSDQRMLGAIVESPAGLFFFKLVGPKAVVGANEGKWNEFAKSFQKGG